MKKFIEFLREGYTGGVMVGESGSEWGKEFLRIFEKV
jgi:hypothetical protein